MGTEIKYTCNNGSWNKSGSCIKVCSGGPTNTVANSSIVSGSGNMYNSSGAVVSFNANSVNNYYYADGYTIRGGCNSGYTKVGDVKYTCNNGSWSSSGSCIKKSGSITYNFIDDTVQSFKPSDHNLVNGDVITLEVWGAQGASFNNKGGLGGYSKGKYTIKDINKTLYVVVGGQGKGGANGYNNCKGTNINVRSGGGGATHISTESGTLDNENVWNNVIIVASGGGAESNLSNGGNGEGTDYKYADTNKKGCGSSCKNCNSGGGGYYGGKAGTVERYVSGSGFGGYSYIGGVTDASTEKGKREGDGMAKISW